MYNNNILNSLGSKIMALRKNKKSAVMCKIIVDDPAYAKYSDGYNRLRDNILYINADGNTKIIQVESAVAGEGKTTTVCNLGVALAKTGKKVVVVDLDFRRPRAHRFFGLNKEIGITEYILGKEPKEKVIKQTGYENLSIITPGGEANDPTLILLSDKFKSFIKSLSETFDCVLLDCPPVLQVSDYIHICKLSDGVLFLVSYACTTKAQVSEAVEELEKNGAKLIGTAFTKYGFKKQQQVSDYYYKENA